MTTSPPTPTPTPTPSPPRVVVDVIIAAPIERVWQALRDPALLAQWFGWDYDKLAEEIDVIFKTGGAEAGRRLDLGGDVFELEVAESGTRVRLVRAEPPASDTWDGVYDDIDEGWRTFVAQLAFWLEAQHGVGRETSPRRTIYLAGHREQADGPTLAAAGALSAIADLAVGERYATTAVTGEELAGVVRFRTEHRVGVSVDAWGPGLLVLAGGPPSPKSPHGGGFALLTTFGASEERLGRLTREWSTAWGAAFGRLTVMPLPDARRGSPQEPGRSGAAIIDDAAWTRKSGSSPTVNGGWDRWRSTTSSRSSAASTPRGPCWSGRPASRPGPARSSSTN
jgi:hypothetical protein